MPSDCRVCPGQRTDSAACPLKDYRPPQPPTPPCLSSASFVMNGSLFLPLMDSINSTGPAASLHGPSPEKGAQLHWGAGSREEPT